MVVKRVTGHFAACFHGEYFNVWPHSHPAELAISNDAPDGLLKCIFRYKMDKETKIR